MQRVVAEVRRRFEGEGSGHDWFHIERVWKMAKRIGAEENADVFIVELAALLHDIADWKFHHDDDSVGPREARTILEQHGVDVATTDRVCAIIDRVTYKDAQVATTQETIEGNIVQDADRLDALGAIGIARAFAYGGKIGWPFYDPANMPEQHATKEAYAAGRLTGTTINHFYEKLLLLKDRMNTVTGKKIAGKRHAFLEEYLKRFYQEWEGKM